MTCYPEDVHHFAGAYALNALDGDEAEQFEGHLGSCEYCFTEVFEFRATAAELASSAAVATPPELRRNLHEVKRKQLKDTNGLRWWFRHRSGRRENA